MRASDGAVFVVGNARGLAELDPGTSIDEVYLARLDPTDLSTVWVHRFGIAVNWPVTYPFVSILGDGSIVVNVNLDSGRLLQQVIEVTGG